MQWNSDFAIKWHQQPVNLMNKFCILPAGHISCHKIKSIPIPAETIRNAANTM